MKNKIFNIIYLIGFYFIINAYINLKKQDKESFLFWLWLSMIPLILGWYNEVFLKNKKYDE